MLRASLIDRQEPLVYSALHAPACSPRKEGCEPGDPELAALIHVFFPFRG
jgi:hypothetical protein